MAFDFSGSGSGTRTRDGCSVDLYRQLPYRGELEPVLPLMRAGQRVLELGCGSGRLTRVLMARGMVVTAVDNSAEMLATLPEGAIPVEADIESLVLGASFDGVLMASCLVNHPDPGLRAAFLSCAHRHLDRSGVLFVERHDPGWLSSAHAGQVLPHEDGSTIAVESAAVDGTLHHMTIRYDLAGQSWRQTFSTERLEASDIEQVLTEHGFADPRWHGARRRWVSARLRSD